MWFNSDEARIEFIKNNNANNKTKKSNLDPILELKEHVQSVLDRFKIDVNLDNMPISEYARDEGCCFIPSVFIKFGDRGIKYEENPLKIWMLYEKKYSCHVTIYGLKKKYITLYDSDYNGTVISISEVK